MTDVVEIAEPVQPVLTIQTEDDFDEANAKILIEMLLDPVTSEPVKLQIINDILDNTKDTTFWETIFQEEMDHSNCPGCGHKNHWLIPEDELNILGYVSADKDPRVPRSTDANTCPMYQQACIKKKLTA